MAKGRYPEMNEMAVFGRLINTLDNRKGADGDTGAFFPRSDAEDFSRGARVVPEEVTLARRAGQKVNFVTECGSNCWYWEMPDGSRIYHFDQMTYNQIGTANKRQIVEGKHGSHFKDGPGPCPYCGNPNTNGGTVKP